jgi:hypothetical protein
MRILMFSPIISLYAMDAPMTQDRVISGSGTRQSEDSAGPLDIMAPPPRTAGSGISPQESRPGAWKPEGRAVAARLVWPASFVAAAVLLFFVYLRLSRTTAVTADFASVAVMAQDMLHGNLLLHGWLITDVSFYMTELPQFMVIEYLRGFTPDVVHVAAAMTYTLVLLLAALLAKGDAKGRQALVRVLVAGGIMVAPQLGAPANILLLSPDHFGTQVPLLLVWLLIDRARPRWYVPVAAGLILAVVQVGDRITAAVAIAPLVVVCGVRVYGAVVQRSEPLISRWYELSLAAASILAMGVASVAAKLITAHGGYTQMSLQTTFASVGDMPAHFWLTVQGVFGMFGAQFFGQHLGSYAAFAVLHLAGVAVAGWAFWRAIRQFSRQDLVVQVLTVAIILNLVLYMFNSVMPWNFWGTREISGVLPMGAVLAGRLAADRLVATRLAPAMAVVLLGYVFALGHGITHPAPPAWGQDAAGWLEGHHLTYGLSEYPQANTITLDSGGRVQVRDPAWLNGIPAPGNYQSKVSWYDPRLHYANFVVALSEPHGGASFISYQARAAFGPPARTYRFHGYVIMVWHKNLLADFPYFR